MRDLPKSPRRGKRNYDEDGTAFDHDGLVDVDATISDREFDQEYAGTKIPPSPPPKKVGEGLDAKTICRRAASELMDCGSHKTLRVMLFYIDSANRNTGDLPPVTWRPPPESCASANGAVESALNQHRVRGWVISPSPAAARTFPAKTQQRLSRPVGFAHCLCRRSPLVRRHSSGSANATPRSRSVAVQGGKSVARHRTTDLSPLIQGI